MNILLMRGLICGIYINNLKIRKLKNLKHSDYLTQNNNRELSSLYSMVLFNIKQLVSSDRKLL
mgnify:FL=1